MVKQQLETIINAELEAKNIVKEAHNRSVLDLQHARTRAQELLAKSADEAKIRSEELIAGARAEAENEARQILGDSEKEAAALYKAVKPKLPEAKKIWQ